MNELESIRGTSKTTHVLSHTRSLRTNINNNENEAAHIRSKILFKVPDALNAASARILILAM